MNINPFLLTDFYKIGHIDQYAPGTRRVFSNFTPRKFKYLQTDRAVVFGLQYFIQKYLVEYFNEYFFQQDLDYVISTYRNRIKKSLRIENPRTDHIEALHKLGYLPLKIYALPEGTVTNENVPHFVIVNTLPDFYWLPNFFETLLSTQLWPTINSATIARKMKMLFLKYSENVHYQGHDFSMRGMLGLEGAILSGMGHLTSFDGTDTIPAIEEMEKYYFSSGAAGSVPATEHSVACSYTDGNEFEYFRRLITEVYSSGIFSVVSDTFDLWKVATEYLPRLRKEILNRDGVVVIRPDSGDPVKIICGDPDFENVPHNYNIMNMPGDKHPAFYGLARLLEHNFGKDNDLFINKVRMIYGDAINFERADAILSGLVAMRLHPENIVFGMGSYLYQYNTRDSLGMAMKATSIENEKGEIIPLFKNPVTDSGLKKSHKGIVTVYIDDNNEYYTKEQSSPEDLDNCAFNVVFENGQPRNLTNLEKIRQNINESIR